jgi:hypothetical protein
MRLVISDDASVDAFDDDPAYPAVAPMEYPNPPPELISSELEIRKYREVHVFIHCSLNLHLGERGLGQGRLKRVGGLEYGNIRSVIH